MRNVHVEQYTDVVLTPEDGDLVQDVEGNLYTGPASLYVCPSGTDPSTVTPIPVSVVAGVWRAEVTATVAGPMRIQIRSEGATKGASPGDFTIIVDPSPFPIGVH